MKFRRGASGLSGILIVDKPAGITSHDVVNAVRRATGEQRVGHAGTLDPLATGVLVVLVGPATRLEPYLSGHDKTYVATIAFGTMTDTDDADGAVTLHSPVPSKIVDPAAAERLLAGFLGPQQQMPPTYSAIKVGGRTAHRAARAGEPLVLEARPIVVYAADLLGIDASVPSWNVRFRVSKGTYIRSLARDIGARAGTAAHVASLRRTVAGTLDVNDAIPLAAFARPMSAAEVTALFTDPVRALEMPALVADVAAVSAGRSIPASPEAPCASLALCDGNRLLAVYHRVGDLLVPEVVLGVPATGVRR
jgi:tRNA pseudouridine55 synthase